MLSFGKTITGGSHARPDQHQSILLSSAVASAARDSLRKPTSNAGIRIVHGEKELIEKLGRNDLCPCGSGRRFQEMLPSNRRLSWRTQESLFSESRKPKMAARAAICSTPGANSGLLNHRGQAARCPRRRRGRDPLVVAMREVAFEVWLKRNCTAMDVPRSVTELRLYEELGGPLVYGIR